MNTIRQLEIEFKVSEKDSINIVVDLYSKSNEIKSKVEELLYGLNEEIINRVYNQILTQQREIISSLKKTSSAVSERLYKESFDKREKLKEQELKKQLDYKNIVDFKEKDRVTPMTNFQSIDDISELSSVSKVTKLKDSMLKSKDKKISLFKETESNYFTPNVINENKYLAARSLVTCESNIKKHKSKKEKKFFNSLKQEFLSNMNIYEGDMIFSDNNSMTEKDFFSNIYSNIEKTNLKKANLSKSKYKPDKKPTQSTFRITSPAKTIKSKLKSASKVKFSESITQSIKVVRSSPFKYKKKGKPSFSKLEVAQPDVISLMPTVQNMKNFNRQGSFLNPTVTKSIIDKDREILNNKELLKEKEALKEREREKEKEKDRDRERESKPPVSKKSALKVITSIKNLSNKNISSKKNIPIENQGNILNSSLNFSPKNEDGVLSPYSYKRNNQTKRERTSKIDNKGYIDEINHDDKLFNSESKSFSDFNFNLKQQKELSNNSFYYISKEKEKYLQTDNLKHDDNDIFSTSREYKNEPKQSLNKRLNNKSKQDEIIKTVTASVEKYKKRVSSSSKTRIVRKSDRNIHYKTNNVLTKREHEIQTQIDFNNNKVDYLKNKTKKHIFESINQYVLNKIKFYYELITNNCENFGDVLYIDESYIPKETKINLIIPVLEHMNQNNIDFTYESFIEVMAYFLFNSNGDVKEF